MAESPDPYESDGGSPLSDLSDLPSGTPEYEDRKPLPTAANNHGVQAGPSKRRKINKASDETLSMPVEPRMDDIDVLSSISSDTSGEVPNSPSGMRPDEDDTPVHEQVTVCAWDGCPMGDMGNMDNLVQHIHDVHIEGRQKKYTCEWEPCTRKSMPHASGYALKAHMRSHTREKPFYCLLPG